jgi:hypothetical protein
LSENSVLIYSGLAQMRRQVMQKLARLQVVSQRMKGFLILEGY